MMDPKGGDLVQFNVIRVWELYYRYTDGVLGTYFPQSNFT